MQTIFRVLIALAAVAIFVVNYKTRKHAREKVDDVENIDGITYLVKDVDVPYVMYKLQSTCMSKYIKSKDCKLLSENECLLRFGGVNYNIGLKGADADMNIGATYRLRCEQKDSDVLMRVSFEKRDVKVFSPSARQPGVEVVKL